MILLILSTKLAKQFLATLSSILIAASLAACSTTPLKKIIREDFNKFEVKSPAQNDSQLGRRVIGAQPETNACYIGQVINDPPKSWSSRTLEYNDGINGQLKMDFGPIITGNASGSEKRKIIITIKDITISKFNDVGVIFNPTSPCATDEQMRAEYESKNGHVDEVITQAVQVGTISIQDMYSGAGKVEIDTNLIKGIPVGAGINGGTSSESTWEGVKLFIAHLRERFRTKLNKENCLLSVGNGQTCDLKPCSIKLNTLSAEHSWTGSLTCEGGSSTNLKGTFGQWVGEVIGNASYSVRASDSDRLGIVKLEFLRWNVVSE